MVRPVTDRLEQALESALRGDPQPLHVLLARGSGLPGPRYSQGLRDAFVQAALAAGARVDRLLAQLATLDADAAPGGTALEFIPVAAVAAAGARAAEDDGTLVPMLDLLHTAAEDLRFRVRDEVVLALAHVGARRGAGIASLLERWMDGYFHAAAVLRALSDPKWLATMEDPTPVLARLEEAFALVRDAPRSAARYPGHKALIEALHVAPGAAAARFGVPVFDRLVEWAKAKDPALREVVEKALGGSRLAGRYSQEVARVRRALEASAPPRRDPRTYVGPTRGRGKKR